MLRQLTQIVLSAMLLLSFNTQAIQKQYNWVVRGRVVDEHGRPVAHASVLVFPPEMLSEWKGHDLLIIEVEADAEGRFRYEGEDLIPIDSKYVLYVTSCRPPDAFTPVTLTPPFDLAKGTDLAFVGRPVRVKSGEEVDVGDVPVQVRYGVVVVHLRNRAGAPMLTDAESWEGVGVRVRDARGKIVDESFLSQAAVRKAVRVDQSAIAIALPEGVWRIEVAPDGEGGRWFTSNLLTVQASDSPLQVILKPPAKRK